MDFRVLGPIEVHTDAGPLELGGAKRRAVLAVLLLNANRVVSGDRLIDDVWGEPAPETAAKALHNHISALRKLLEPERRRAGLEPALLTRPPGYVLRLAPDELDLARFERLRADGIEALAAGRHGAARAKLVEALALWRGAALADLAHEPFAQAESGRLEELRIVTLEERIEADLALGRHAEVVGELESLVAEHPLRERLHAHLMLALYRSDRQADALNVYQRARRTLVDGLGLEPGERLRALERAVLVQDSDLAFVPSAKPVLRAPARERAGAGAFVGREAELRRLLACLDQAFTGSGRLVLISGEPGIGKSRLTDELLAEARARGAEILVGRCWEAGGAPAYWPWVQALRVHLQASDIQALRTRLGAAADDLAQILPEIQPQPSRATEAAPTTPEAARFRLFDAASTVLLSAATQRPVVLALDDLHAADEPSLLLLRFLARQNAEKALLIICTYRDVDPTLRNPLRSTLADLEREPHTVDMSLSGFAEEDVRQYVELSTGTQPAPSLTRAIHEETEGNALFVSQLVRLLEAEGRIDEPDTHLGIPPGVRTVITRRLERLSGRCRDLLVRASVIGREFDLETLTRVGGTRSGELLDVLDEAFRERVLGEVPGGHGRLRFGHALIRDTLYDDLGPVRRMQLHREVGEALEEIHADDLDAHLAQIARHLVAGAPTGGSGKAVEYARRAGDRASAQLAYEEAARHYEMALGLVRPDTTRCELLLAIGDARARAGDAAASKEAYREAARLAARNGVPAHLAQAALGYGGRFSWTRASTDPEYVPLLERALAAVGKDDSPARVLLLSRLAAARRDDPLRGARKRLVEEAVAIAERIGDPDVLVRALEAYWMAVEGPDTHELMRLMDTLVELAQETGDKEVLFAVHDHLLHARWALADRTGIDTELAVVRALAEDLRQPAQRWSAGASHATLVLMEGDLARAEDLIVETLAMGREAQTWNAVVTHRLSLFVLRRAQGRLPEVAETIRRSVDEYPSLLRFGCAHVHASAHLGRRGEAQAALAELMSHDLANEHVDSEWLFSISLLADPCAVLGDRGAATKLYGLLQPYEDRYAEAPVEAAFGSVARALGVLATTLGRLDDAERHFERALEIEDRMGARPWLAHAREAFGDMLLHRRAAGDGPRAEELLDEAVRGYGDLGMDWWAARAKTRAHEVV